MSIAPAQFKTVAVIAAQTAEDKKAEEILLLDLRKSAYGLSDFLLILTANSETHLRTLMETIKEKLKGLGHLSIHQDGVRSSRWSVLDYGGLLIHIFDLQTRQLYSLDRLYENAKAIPWASGPISRKKPRTKKTKSG